MRVNSFRAVNSNFVFSDGEIGQLPPTAASNTRRGILIMSLRKWAAVSFRYAIDSAANKYSLWF